MGGQIDILIVDDDPDIRITLAEVFEAEGYRAVAAPGGGEALSILRTHGPPGVILLDLMMPHIDGLQFVEAYRKSGLATAPIVLLSAAQNVPARARELGVHDYLVKPFDLDDLIAIGETYCGHRARIFGPSRDVLPLPRRETPNP